ncbi:MAG: tRNA pseudouridine(55) synthase TruB [Actinomycetota bacterium]|nr:tRNA pseudouridine(55) synthase TruB [Actinomycetota bacterium]
MVDGLLLIDKHAGPTSHDFVNMLRRMLGQKRVGHAGTLDPAATGLLVLLLGKATRLAPWLQATEKVYEGTIRLGRATTTFDAHGEATEDKPGDVDEERLKAAALALVGEISQVPPAYSAVKVDGTPAYVTARKGGQVELKARRVVINELQVQKIESGDYPLVSFKVACSSGTFIRSLAVDFGNKLGCPAHLSDLRRLRAGKFSVAQALPVEDFSNLDEEGRRQRIISMRAAIEAAEVCPPVDRLPAVRDGVEFTASADQSLGLNDDRETIVKIIDPRTGDLFGLGKVKGILVDSGEVVVKPFLVLASE